MGAYSEEQGERFYHKILAIECCYQGLYNENIMGDYIWEPVSSLSSIKYLLYIWVLRT